MKTHSRTPQSHSQKTDSTLLTKFLVILGIFGVTTFVTYGAVSTPESAFMSTPYMTRSSTGDLVLSNATNGQGAAILNAYIAKILSGATAQWGVPAYNAYLNDKLNQLDLLDTELQGKRDNNGKLIYDKDYTFIFSYIYPRLHEQLKLDQTTSVIGEIRSRLWLNWPVDDSNLRPIPAAPAVTANDTTDTVNGWNAATMEASLSSDGWNSYGAFTSATQDLNGNKMLYVRLKATNTALSSLITVLTFTENTQQSTGFTFSASFNPATISATGSSVLSYSSNAAGGCSYNLAGGNGWTANGNVTINASAFNIPAGTTTNTGRTVTFACYNANSTLAGTGSASITILAPPAVVAATPAPTVFIKYNGSDVANETTLNATSDGKITLTWWSTNANSCLIDGPDGKLNGLASTSGSETFTGFTTTAKSKYTYKCSGPGATDATKTTFYVQGVAPVVVTAADIEKARLALLSTRLFYVDATNLATDGKINFKIDKSYGYKGCQISLTTGTNVWIWNHLKADGTFEWAILVWPQSWNGVKMDFKCVKELINGGLANTSMKYIMPTIELATLVRNPVYTLTEANIPGITGTYTQAQVDQAIKDILAAARSLNWTLNSTLAIRAIAQWIINLESGWTKTWLRVQVVYSINNSAIFAETSHAFTIADVDNAVTQRIQAVADEARVAAEALAAAKTEAERVAAQQAADAQRLVIERQAIVNQYITDLLNNDKNLTPEAKARPDYKSPVVLLVAKIKEVEAQWLVWVRELVANRLGMTLADVNEYIRLHP